MNDFELPGMWEEADLIGGETDATDDGRWRDDFGDDGWWNE